MKKRIAVTGEGPTDYGQSEYNPRTGRNEWNWGPVKGFCILCLKAGDEGQHLEFYPVPKEEVKRMKLLRSDIGLEGRAIPARKFRNLCREQHLEYGIFYSDADRGGDSGKIPHSARKHFEKVYQEVIQGLQAEESSKFIPMVPLKMIECWLLADESAYEKYFGKIPKLPSAPELIWGNKEDPESDYPKCYIIRAIKQASNAKLNSGREVFSELVQDINVEVLKRKCPISFSTFYEDFRKLYNALEDEIHNQEE
ncbi:MAG: DUF4276 family protein [Lachnospiraceae bacterium]|nr:DUF4276 family protein [Lachnospiraceae bacterium]